MNDAEEAEVRARVLAAVQRELDRHAAVVLAESERLRNEAADETARLVRSLEQRIDALGTLLGESESGREIAEQALREQIESSVQTRVEFTERLIGEAEARASRRLEQVTVDLDGLVEASCRPLLDAFGDEQAAIMRRVEAFATDLRSFDEQAARMVVFFNELSASIDERSDELVKRIDDEVVRRVAGLDARVEEVMASSLRQHIETTQRVNERTERIEERMNQRAFAFEDKLKQDAGQRIAEIDAHLGRVAHGLDDTLEVLNERLARIEASIEDLDRRFEDVRTEIRAVDTEVLEELKEKISSAVGEATLVRIDMDRLQKTATEQVDQLLVRMVSVESELADSTMDVSTAVQLERLEELERAVMELGPSSFPSPPPPGAPSTGPPRAFPAPPIEPV